MGVIDYKTGVSQDGFDEVTSEEIRPEDTEPHYHPCSVCQDPQPCWCPFPEKNWEDEFSICDECKVKRDT